jgi:hypothetical protein
LWYIKELNCNKSICKPLPFCKNLLLKNSENELTKQFLTAYDIAPRKRRGCKIEGLVLYTMYAVLGLMLLDFVVGLVRSVVTNTFTVNMVLDYLKSVLYMVFPLIVILSLVPIDPTGWALKIFYYIGGLAIIWNYLVSMVSKWRA